MHADEILVTVRRILTEHPVGALFLSNNDGGEDELMWVGPVALTPQGRHLVMLSSRYSRVALSIRENAPVTWNFTDGDEEAQVTISGTAHLADTPSSFAKWADYLSQEAKDCLLQYPSHTYGFTAVVTQLESVRVTVPSHGIDVSCRIPHERSGRKGHDERRVASRAGHSKAA